VKDAARGSFRRSLATVLAIAAVLAGCRGFGPGLPVCGQLGTAGSGDAAHLTVTDRSGETLALRTSHLMQAQAVPTAARGVCVDELPGGWEAGMDEPRSGEAVLWLASPGLGGRFVDVRLVGSCTPTERAHRTAAGTPDVERWVDVHDEGRRIAVTVVPVAERHRKAAWDTAVALIGRELRGSSLRIEVAGSERGSAASRIAAALEADSPVLVIDDEFELRRELELRVPGQGRPFVGPLGEVLAELGERAPAPHYAATWWELGTGGCIVYEFDASGPDVAALEDDTRRAVGGFPLDEVRRRLAELDERVAAS
jgi:hypothetical protein